MTKLWGKAEKKEKPTRPKNTAKHKGDTYLGKDLTINGNISGEDNFQIDGSVEGEFDLKGDIQIGASAKIKGDIRAKKIVVGGEVKGKLDALEKIHIESSARVFGSMITPRLSIEDGAVFNGDTVMETKTVTGSKTILTKPKPIEPKPVEKSRVREDFR